jgi:hypothetical protein
MRIKLLLIILVGLVSMNLYSQDLADSLYWLAWDKHNNEEYEEAAKLFEESFLLGKNTPVADLNAASSWAFADNKEKVFENLEKLPEAGYLDKDFILMWFSEFYKYHETQEWKNLMSAFDTKIDEFYSYAKTVDFQKLTNQQMIEDFDTLQNTILRVSPHLKLKEKVYGISFQDYFNDLRKEVENCNSSDTFALILYKALIVCQDGHTSFTSLNPFEHLSDGESKDFCASIAKYQMLINSVKVISNNLPKLIYSDGKYFLAKEFTYNDTKIPIKSELISVNNQLPKDYILKNIEYKSSLSWDFNNNCFYSETFLQQNIATDTIINLKFKNKKKEFLIDVNFSIGYTPAKISSVENGFVYYWGYKQILYIRMPKMVNGLFYADEILKYKDFEIDKIIVDIRDNPGGSDLDWSDMLNSIVSENYKPEIKLGFNSQNLEKFEKSEIFDYSDFPELDLKYIVSETGFEHEEQENLNYKGNIYIFYNQYTYSSAGSLVNLCYYFDNIIAVGETTGRVLGFGINPSEFELPNTKIKFRIAPTIDLTNVVNYQDIFHDKPEIEINTTIDDEILLYDNPYTIEFIKNYDPYIKQIMKIK